MNSIQLNLKKTISAQSSPIKQKP